MTSSDHTHNDNHEEKRYAGKTALITGGTSGVGLATARLLTARGARVLITGRDDAALDAARSELGGEAIAVRSDTARLQDVDELAQRVSAEFGHLDLLLLNAGITRSSPLPEMEVDTYDEVFDINTKGPYFTAQRLAPLIIDGGSIVLVTSVANQMGLPALGAYAASKAALRSMARTWATELMDQGIRVNAVTLGPIDTGILRKTLPPEQAAAAESQYRDTNPMHRFGRPDEVAEAIAFLAFTATFTTGAELPVDGGASQL